MDILDVLPHLNALLNATSLVLISIAYVAIQSGDKAKHKKMMISALAVSTVFLVSYLYYHANVGHTPFKGEGGVRPVYFFILFTHIGAAAIALVMIIITVLRAILGQFDKHRPIAKLTFPLWWFVCASGIVVYVMAFHAYTGNA